MVQHTRSMQWCGLTTGAALKTEAERLRRFQQSATSEHILMMRQAFEGTRGYLAVLFRTPYL